MPAINRPTIDNEYGPNNPEPPGLKDSTTVRDYRRDGLHAALEYIEGTQAAETTDEG